LIGAQELWWKIRHGGTPHFGSATRFLRTRKKSATTLDEERVRLVRVRPHRVDRV
jgi:hypothetical protein